MPSKDELKQRAFTTIDKMSEETIGIAKQVYQNPETGYQEFKTSQTVSKKFSELGISNREHLAITDVKGEVLGNGGPGPRVAIIGELDALPVPDHPFADPQTSAAHACGHAAQIGMLLGATGGLVASGAIAHLSGSIVPFAVPAEEFVEVEKRLTLRQQGKISFLDGKQELIRIGEFDDVDMAIMCHTSSSLDNKLFSIGGTTNGNVLKFIKFIGKGAHACAEPHQGINALNAACWALMAINTNREVFKEEEIVRIHGILQRGGDVVSTIPDDVRLEWRVRSGNLDAVIQNSLIVDRCFKAGAPAVGASVSISTVAGSLPLANDLILEKFFLRNAQSLLGSKFVLTIPATTNNGASTDMGDLSHIMPVCHPFTSGAAGLPHSKAYSITDWKQAVINPAKIMAGVVIDLLADKAVGAKQVLSKSNPPMTKNEYVRFQEERMSVTIYEGTNGTTDRQTLD